VVGTPGAAPKRRKNFSLFEKKEEGGSPPFCKSHATAEKDVVIFNSVLSSIKKNKRVPDGRN